MVSQLRTLSRYSCLYRKVVICSHGYYGFQSLFSVASIWGRLLIKGGYYCKIPQKIREIAPKRENICTFYLTFELKATAKNGKQQTRAFFSSWKIFRFFGNVALFRRLNCDNRVKCESKHLFLWDQWWLCCWLCQIYWICVKDFMFSTIIYFGDSWEVTFRICPIHSLTGTFCKHDGTNLIARWRRPENKIFDQWSSPWFILKT